MWGTALILVFGAVAVIALLQRRASARIYRPLSSRQPERRTRDVPLGMEAIDMDELSRTNRRNESLERGQTNWLSAKGFFGRPDTDIAPLADDETYAKRYSDAFHNDTPKD